MLSDLAPEKMVAEMIAMIGRDDHHGIVPVATLLESLKHDSDLRVDK